jgi:hypothetical protein
MSNKELHQDSMNRKDTFGNITVSWFTACHNYEDRYHRFGGRSSLNMEAPDVGIILLYFTTSHSRRETPPLQSQTSNRNAYPGNKNLWPESQRFSCINSITHSCFCMSVTALTDGKSYALSLSLSLVLGSKKVQ